jgi:peptidoglycan/LPS O-acetylase OafA/YrhL
MLRLPNTQLGETDKTLTPSFPSPLSVSTHYRFMHRRVARILVPSFLSHNSPAPRDEKRPTDFLDGMRGYAAFTVFFSHFFMPTHPRGTMGFGGNKGVGDYWPTQLPILRLVYSGHVSVSLFFVIAGFYISLKPLKQARNGLYSSFLDTLSSAIFRRTCRLYLPCIATLFVTFVMACCGAFDFQYALTKRWPFGSKPVTSLAIQPNVWLQFKDFVGQVWQWSDPFARGSRQHIAYGVQLWTIPTELFCSFVSFFALVGLAKVRPNLRMGITTAVAIYFQFRKHPEVTLFLAGGVLAELYIMRQERAASATSRCQESRAKKMQSVFLFILGLFLASYPPKGADKAPFTAPLYHIATSLIGRSVDVLHLFVSIASVLLVYVVSRSHFLQDMFATPFAKYLGKISFALYCVHQALINWFGYRSMLFFWGLTGSNTTVRYELGLILAFFFQTIATIWAADIFWRCLDQPTVGVTKWLEAFCAVRSR